MKLATVAAVSISSLLLTSMSTFAQIKLIKSPQLYKTGSYSELNIKKTAPSQVCKVCVQWEKGQPGTFAGPCIRYEYQPCSTPPVVK